MFATESRLLVDFTGAGTRRPTTGLAPGRPDRPVSHYAVHLTFLLMANLAFEEWWATGTTVCSQVDEGAFVVFAAATTTLGASVPFSPVTDFAVNRTEVSVAGLPLVQVRAFDTTMLVVFVDVTLAFLLATAAGLVAWSPGAEVSYVAVNGTMVLVAIGTFFCCGTRDATFRCHTLDSANTLV